MLILQEIFFKAIMYRMKNDNKITLDANQKKLMAQMASPWKIRLFFWQKLPSVFFWRVKVATITPEKAAIAIPFSNRTKNPFRSIYFASQAGAAELSTGLIALIATHKNNVSMLVANMNAIFVKKATSTTTFTCTEGEKIFGAVKKSIETGEGQTVTVKTTGVQATGEIVSEFEFTWTFKQRKG